MRQGSNSRRSRGRGQSRRGQNNVPNRNQVFESNGPDGRIRGNAQQVYEKYIAHARDAQAAGEWVQAENYLQHAEHYYRILNSFNDAQNVQRQPAGPLNAPGAIESFDEVEDEDPPKEAAPASSGDDAAPAVPGKPPAAEFNDLSDQPQPDFSLDIPVNGRASEGRGGESRSGDGRSGADGNESGPPRRRRRGRNPRRDGPTNDASADSESGSSEETAFTNGRESSEAAVNGKAVADDTASGSQGGDDLARPEVSQGSNVDGNA